jgi:hypothetical protein
MSKRPVRTSGGMIHVDDLANYANNIFDDVLDKVADLELTEEEIEEARRFCVAWASAGGGRL